MRGLKAAPSRISFQLVFRACTLDNTPEDDEDAMSDNIDSARASVMLLFLLTVLVGVVVVVRFAAISADDRRLTFLPSLSVGRVNVGRR